MVRGITERMEAERIGLEGRIAAMDETAEAQRIASLTQLSQAAAQQAEAVRRAELQAQLIKEEKEAVKLRNFQQSLSALGNTIAVGIKYNKLQEAAKKAEWEKREAKSERTPGLAGSPRRIQIS